MNKAAKIGMLIWTILCFLGTCGGMMNVANKSGGNLSGAETVGAGIGLFIWMLIWFFPMVAMGIVALVTRPKTAANAPLSAASAMPSLCPHCGKYFGGQRVSALIAASPRILLRRHLRRQANDVLSYLWIAP
jgi:hypothetical protein